MSANIQFISLASGASITPTYGFNNASFTISGENLDYATGVKFVDMFQNEINADFAIQSPNTITGNSPLLDASLGAHEVRVTNELGHSKICCFSPLQPVQTSEPRRLVQHTTTEITDHLGINAPIQESGPNNTQGYEIASISAQALHAANQFIISCELSLENDFWGSAVVALFKDSESSPRKVWNYGMIGLNMGQMASMTYLETAGDTDWHTWKIRLGRTHTSASTIYLNRNINNNNPYGLDIAKSYLTVTEIEAGGVS